MSRNAQGELSPLLRESIETGDWSRFAERLATDAVLDTSNESGRRRVVGAEEIAAHLSGPGPGSVHHWDAQEWPTGVALTFEWEGETGPDRRRWYVRADPAGRVTE